MGGFWRRLLGIGFGRKRERLWGRIWKKKLSAIREDGFPYICGNPKSGGSTDSSQSTCLTDATRMKKTKWLGIGFILVLVAFWVGGSAAQEGPKVPQAAASPTHQDREQKRGLRQRVVEWLWEGAPPQEMDWQRFKQNAPGDLVRALWGLGWGAARFILGVGESLMNIAGVVIPQAGRLAERYRTGEDAGKDYARWRLAELEDQQRVGVGLSPWQQIQKTFWYEPTSAMRYPQEELVGLPAAIVKAGGRILLTPRLAFSNRPFGLRYPTL